MFSVNYFLEKAENEQSMEQFIEGKMKNRKILALAAGCIVVVLIGIAVWVGLSRSSGDANVRVEGTVTAVRGDRITLKSDDGTQVVVLVTKQTVQAGQLGSSAPDGTGRTITERTAGPG